MKEIINAPDETTSTLEDSLTSLSSSSSSTFSSTNNYDKYFNLALSTINEQTPKPVNIFAPPKENQNTELIETIKNLKWAVSTLSQITTDKSLPPSPSDQNSNLKSHLTLPLSSTTYYLEGSPVPPDKIELLITTIKTGINANLIPNPVEQFLEIERFNNLITDVESQLRDKILQVNIEEFLIYNYADIILCESFTPMLSDYKSNNTKDITGICTNVASKLMSDVIESANELDSKYIQIVKEILNVALDKKYETPRECAEALSDCIRKKDVSGDFMKWLSYKIGEENFRIEGLRNSGSFETIEEEDDESSWLKVLQIVQNGCLKESSKKVDRYITPISYMLRLETKQQRFKYLNLVVKDFTESEQMLFRDTVDKILGNVGEEGYELLGENIKGLMELGEGVEIIWNRQGLKVMQGEEQKLIK
ncbi:hypothetical protein TL16_g08340 [Triparma laevis f. inornata]|uniref:Uncharacterized protein n=1 Tax=Triparma laevis f. inornata TaxID=1714386 RepID=A0A9W7B0P0_9STRA|nr:hypothetical protein TL16_g08340 [Triparma laevis f. inornata]